MPAVHYVTLGTGYGRCTSTSSRGCTYSDIILLQRRFKRKIYTLLKAALTGESYFKEWQKISTRNNENILAVDSFVINIYLSH